MRDVHTEAGAGLRCSVQLFTTSNTPKHSPSHVAENAPWEAGKGSKEAGQSSFAGANGVAGGGEVGLSEGAAIDRISLPTRDAQLVKYGLDKCESYDVLIGIDPSHKPI